jgi:hypothetical protein
MHPAARWLHFQLKLGLRVAESLQLGYGRAPMRGGRGVVVLECPACEKRINTMSQFLDNLADDVLPALIERLSETKSTRGY